MSIFLIQDKLFISIIISIESNNHLQVPTTTSTISSTTTTTTTNTSTAANFTTFQHSRYGDYENDFYDCIPQIDGIDDILEEDEEDLEPPSKKPKTGPSKAKNYSKSQINAILEVASNDTKLYGGDLKRQKAYFPLNNFFVCIREQNRSDLASLNVNNLVFVKFIKIFAENGSPSHTLCCLKCNGFAEIIIANFKEIKVMDEGQRTEMINWCKHTKVVDVLNLAEDLEDKNTEGKTVTKLQDIPHISAALSQKGDYGIVFVNNNFHSKIAKCAWPCNKSKSCDHVISLRKGLDYNGASESDSDEDSDESECDSFDISPQKFYNKIPAKIKWPLSANTKAFFHEIETLRFSDLHSLVPSYYKELKCPHGNSFNPACPIDEKWIVSTDVRFFHIGLVEQIKRTVYFRPTIADEMPCHCRQSYTGELDMVVCAKLNSYNQRENNKVSYLSILPPFD